jgi:YD repeat-containing protein
MRYDGRGNLIEVSDPARGGDADGDGRDDQPASLSCDDRNNVLSVTDARGIVTRFDYNEFNQPTSMTSAAGTPIQAVTRWEYDSKTGLLVLQTDPTGVKRRYAYDSLGTLQRP